MAVYDFSTPASYGLDPRGLATAESDRYDDLEYEYEARLKELRRLNNLDYQEISAEFESDDAYALAIEEAEERCNEIREQIEYYN